MELDRRNHEGLHAQLFFPEVKSNKPKISHRIIMTNNAMYCSVLWINALFRTVDYEFRTKKKCCVIFTVGCIIANGALLNVFAGTVFNSSKAV